MDLFVVASIVSTVLSAIASALAIAQYTRNHQKPHPPCEKGATAFYLTPNPDPTIKTTKPTKKNQENMRFPDNRNFAILC